jgi:hypothetical protein
LVDIEFSVGRGEGKWIEKGTLPKIGRNCKIGGVTEKKKIGTDQLESGEGRIFKFPIFFISLLRRLVLRQK